jgi:chemotaxis protein MotB
MSLDSQELKRILRKRESTDDTDAEGSWAISYGDMITLLLTFFVLFFNVNTKKNETKELLQKAIMTEFGVEKGASKEDQAKEAPRMSMGDQKDGELEANTLKEWGGTLHRDGDKVVIEFPNTTFYDLGKVDVKEQSVKVLQQFANKYVKFAGTSSLSIKAFTDSVPVRNSQRFHDNLELSALRAIAAMRVLQHSGIPLDRMKISGHGETLTRKPSSETDANGAIKTPDEFARKVILVIEPFTKEKL